MEWPVSVDEEERLRRGGGALAFGGAGKTRGRVECSQDFRLVVALFHRVDGAAQGGAGFCWAARFQVEFTAGSEHGVAHLLGVEASRIEPPEIAVGGIGDGCGS